MLARRLKRPIWMGRYITQFILPLPFNQVHWQSESLRKFNALLSLLCHDWRPTSAEWRLCISGLFELSVCHPLGESWVFQSRSRKPATGRVAMELARRTNQGRITCQRTTINVDRSFRLPFLNATYLLYGVVTRTTIITHLVSLYICSAYLKTLSSNSNCFIYDTILATQPGAVHYVRDNLKFHLLSSTIKQWNSFHMISTTLNHLKLLT